MKKKPLGKNTKYSRSEIILKIGHLARAIARCKGYSGCKMVRFGRKLKWPKTCANPFYKKTRVFLCKKTAGKNTKYSRNETILKIGHLARAIARCKGYSSCKMVRFGQKLKWPKTCANPFYKKTRVFLCKKTAGKNTKYSRDETILKIGHLAKARAFATWSV